MIATLEGQHGFKLIAIYCSNPLPEVSSDDQDYDIRQLQGHVIISHGRRAGSWKLPRQGAIALFNHHIHPFRIHDLKRTP